MRKKERKKPRDVIVEPKKQCQKEKQLCSCPTAESALLIILAHFTAQMRETEISSECPSTGMNANQHRPDII